MKKFCCVPGLMAMICMISVAVAVGFSGSLATVQAPITVPPGTTWSVQYLIDNSQTVLGDDQITRPRNNRGLALSPDGQYLYAGYNNPTSGHQVRKINLLEPDYTDATVAHLMGKRGKAIATDDVGRVYLADASSITVWDANLTTLQLTIATATTLGATVSAAEGVAVTREGGVLVLYSSDRTTGYLTKRWLTEGGGAVVGATLAWTVYLAPPEAELRGVEVDPVTGNVWTAGIKNDTVYVVNPSSGSVGTVNNVNSPIDIAFDGRTALITREYDLLISLFDADTLASAGADLAPPLTDLKLKVGGGLDCIVVASPGVYYVAGNGINTADEKSTYGVVDGKSGYGLDGKYYTDLTADDNDPILRVVVLITYTLTYTAGANGSITGELSQTVNKGKDGSSVTADPAIGYHFVDWSDGLTANPRTDTNVTTDISVTALFAINTYTLTASAGPNGTIAPSGVLTVNYGDSRTFSFTPSSGYSVADVTVNAASVGNPVSYTLSAIAANYTINVTFAQIVLAAQVNIDPNTLNLKSNGNWVTGFIELPTGYKASAINIATVKISAIDGLPVELFAEKSPVSIGVKDLMVKFSRSKLASLLVPGNAVLTVTGTLTSGHAFKGTSTIRVI